MEFTSPAQVTANQANAQHSTGPKTPEGIAVSSRNNFRHGLSANAFGILDWESEEEFRAIHANLRQEHAPPLPPKSFWSNPSPNTSGSCSAPCVSRTAAST